MRPSTLLFATTAIVLHMVEAQATTSGGSAATQSVCNNLDLQSCTEGARATTCSLQAACECTQFSSISACFSSYCGGASAVPTLWLEDVDFWCATSIYSGVATGAGTGTAAATASKTSAGAATAAATSKAGAGTLPVQVGGVLAAMIMAVVAYL